MPTWTYINCVMDKKNLLLTLIDRHIGRETSMQKFKTAGIQATRRAEVLEVSIIK